MKNETKSLQRSNFHITSVDKKGLFAGYASIFDTIDDQNDIIIPGAFKQSLENWERQNKWPKMLWQHNRQEPIGRWLFIEEDQKGLYVEGQLLLDVQKAKEAYALMRAGAVDGLSIGYLVIKADRDSKRGLRYIHQIELLEISVVTFAANSAAQITKVKAHLYTSSSG